MPNPNRIATTLAALGRRGHRSHIVDACAQALGGLCVGLGFAVILAQFGFAKTALGWVAAAGTLAPVYVATRWRQSSHKWLHQPQSAARLAEQLAPELGSAATTAVNLQQRLAAGDTTFSADLAVTHLDNTVSALERINLPERLTQSLRPRRGWTAAATAAAMVFLALLAVTLHNGRSRLVNLMLDPHSSRLSDVPLAGDIRLTYHYPEYTGLAVRVVQGGDGSIAAVTGTEVELHATADMQVRRAALRVQDAGATTARDVPMETSQGNQLQAKVAVLRDGQYHFVLVDDGGDTIEDKQSHPIRATLDAFPEIHMDEPAADVELRDNQVVAIQWRAKDDFGINDVELVVEKPGGKEPTRIPLTGERGERRSGTYQWSVVSLRLEAGKEARFHLEVTDNDTISGPKRASSITRRLVVFSARQHHEELVFKERAILDQMVDWLGQELQAPTTNERAAAVQAHLGLGKQMDLLGQSLLELTQLLRADHLSKPEVVAAFVNVQEHVQSAAQGRAQTVESVKKVADDHLVPLLTRLASLRARDIKQLETDIIYIDDLLAIARLDELKQTARQLLSAQHDLQGLLAQYRETKNPALQAELQERIRDLREKMTDLLTKMGDIKKSLPGEYRNMEANSMLHLDEELGRLEKTLEAGNLEAAAQQLEQLANMVENMVNSINTAEEEYGGDRYKEVRNQLNEFADSFKQLEKEQQALSQRSDELLRQYRQKSVERAGKDLQSFVHKAREQTRKGLQELDELAQHGDVARQFDRDLEAARQSLLDLDALLEHRDFAEARQVSQQASVLNEALLGALRTGVDRYPNLPRGDMQAASKNSHHAFEAARDVAAMLEKLFPDANTVLSPEQMAQMQRMAKKQDALQQQALALENKMEELSSELPLFGGEPKSSLQGAKNEMGQAARDIGQGELSGGASHSKRAMDQLGKLRQALERASQRAGQGGLPLPLEMESGQQEGGNGFGNSSNQEVEIPKSDRNRSSPRFRQDLMDAAKQKPPSHFEDAVRRYYEELIR